MKGREMEGRGEEEKGKRGERRGRGGQERKVLCFCAKLVWC